MAIPIATRIEQGKCSITDEDIWRTAKQTSFVPPPQPWSFKDSIVSFGSNQYQVSDAVLFELALLDIHSQYWEATSPEYLRRYHRGLQYHVETCFQTSGSMEISQTPSFLKPWVVRTIFRKIHDEKGREGMLKILNNVPAAERSKLENGDFQADDWKKVISNRYHQQELIKMIKGICDARRISRYGKTRYSWRLPLFEAIKWDEGETSSNANQSLIPPSFCLLYQQELLVNGGGSSNSIFSGQISDFNQWDEEFLGTLRSRNRMVGNISFEEPQANRLLRGLWLNDDVIDIYLVLCEYLQPGIRFLPTQWFSCLKNWKEEASSKSANWISKHTSDISAAMSKFSGVVTVINYPKNHWMTIRFDPERQTLEVFDSLSPQNFSHRKQNIHQKIIQPLGLSNWNIRQGQKVPQQKGDMDCGLYAAQFAKHLALDLPFFQTLDEEQTRFMRRMMAVEIADGRIRTPWDI